MSTHRRFLSPRAGISPDTPIALARKIRIANLSALIGIGASLITALFQLLHLVPTAPNEPFFSLLPSILFCVVIFLNYVRKHRIAFVTLCVDLTCILGFLSVGYGPSSGIKYLIIATAVLPTMLFDQPIIRSLLFLLNVTAFFTVTYLQSTMWPFLVPRSEPAMLETDGYLMLNQFLLFSMLFFILNYFRKDHEAYEEIIEQKNLSLEEAKEEITTQRDELEQLNVELEQKNEEISSQRDMLEQTSRSLLETNNTFRSSIQYAQRIQHGTLPSHQEIASRYPEHFVLLKPRDIVSGDAYYFRDLGDRVILATIDCTGHGVPGALMTMTVNALLDQVVLDYRLEDPAEIMEALHTGIRRAVNPASGVSNDGMDMGLVIIHPQEGRLTYCGARHNLYHLSGDEPLQTIRATNRSVGDHLTQNRPFERHEISITPGLTIYLFSDGFPDQFGGARGKKYMRKRFRELLTQHAHQPMPDQKMLLEEELNNWTSNWSIAQVDDILVMGVAIA